MSRKNNEINRRNFLKTVGAAGLSSVLVSRVAKADPNDPNAMGKTQEPVVTQVPKRKFGKTDIEVSCLGLGTMFNLIDNQVILRSTLNYGVSYWDTANNYAGGNSELGIGKFLEKNPEEREKLFLVSKASGAGSPAQLEQRLKTSFERMNTNYIDLYYGVHGCESPGQLTDYLRKWAEDAKKRKAIRFFGFSTHKNMAKCLAAAAKLDWIDAIMTSYNFRLMQDPELQDAIDACHQANIGIVAMKTTGKTTISSFRMEIENEAEQKMVAHFLQQGFTPVQAAIKLVLEDKRISSACVQMENISFLKTNVEAVLEKTKLAEADKRVLKQYAEATCSGYCAGCTDICNSALPDMPYVSDVMRYLMYFNSYGDNDRARKLFAQIPRDVRNRLLSTDYGPAELCCPQHLPIGKLMAEAVKKLA
jgi:predicted aldo/keto reductase-like oxidoreductase